jgi:hypothetical protein
VHILQKYRSEKLIREVEGHRAQTSELTEFINIPLGINYKSMENKESYVVSYSRGFVVTEKYDSKDKHWRGFGWND